MRKRRRSLGTEPKRQRSLRAVTNEKERTYPGHSALRTLLANSAKVTAGGGLALGLLATGCEPPTCASSRTEEISNHTGRSMDELMDFEFGNAAQHLGEGFGIVSHSPTIGIAVAGAMPVVHPPPPPSPTGTSVENDED